MNKRTRIGGLAAIGAVALAAALPVSATTGQLQGEVGPGFKIEVQNAAGADVKRVRAGTYRILIEDKSAIHSFHLRGPGVNKTSGVAFKGKTAWTIRLQKGGTYRYFCDPHAPSMRGSFRAV